MEDILQKYQKCFNAIIEEDRNIRRRGLEDIKSLFRELKEPGKLVEIFQKYIFKNLMRVMDDKVEKHREACLGLIDSYLSFAVSHRKDYLDEVVNTLIRFLIARINT